MSNMTPTGNRLLVKREKAKTKTDSGIALPTDAQQKPNRGLVVAAGPGRLDEKGERIKMSIQTGDEILFAENGVMDVKINGDDLLVMSEEAVLLVAA